ncbi:hypothetical protein BH780_gp142 [Bacillus phage Eldridge]|uniref:Uncharacterized protein n=1 Tax=Bacillus phage Eldridge TaxID=1776293 RepID=A0A0Y0AFE8_9CAUD|nr:hypothetical protein BH780_gp142 [Bacillus phage Eldridge]AMB18725.1 hypothetical protein Eldridge_0145 [Bacillus phage Eldridge]
MNKIKSHDIMDVWQVRDGFLVEVMKYKSLGYARNFSGAKTKIVRGCSGLKELKEEWVLPYSNKTFPAGTLFLHGTPVEPLTDPNDFVYGLKSSGGALYGSWSEMESVLADVQSIIDSYKEEN